MSEHHVSLAKLGIQAVLALVVLVLMVWIIVTPTVTDETTKAALVIVSSTVGFLFGKNT